MKNTSAALRELRSALWARARKSIAKKRWGPAKKNAKLAMKLAGSMRQLKENGENVMLRLATSHSATVRDAGVYPNDGTKRVNIGKLVTAIAMGFDVNRIGLFKESLLHLAARSSYRLEDWPLVFHLLLRAGGNPNAVDARGNTPFSTFMGHVQDTHRDTNVGQSEPFMKMYAAIVKMFIDAKANINVVPNSIHEVTKVRYFSPLVNAGLMLDFRPGNNGRLNERTFAIAAQVYYDMVMAGAVLNNTSEMWGHPHVTESGRVGDIFKFIGQNALQILFTNNSHINTLRLQARILDNAPKHAISSAALNYLDDGMIDRGVHAPQRYAYILRMEPVLARVARLYVIAQCRCIEIDPVRHASEKNQRLAVFEHIMRKLVERGAAVDGIKYRDRSYVNPMMECIYVVHRWNTLLPNPSLDLIIVRLVNFLLSLKADPNANSVQPLVGVSALCRVRETAPEGFNTPLLMCARHGYTKSVRALLKGGADPLKKYAIRADNPLFNKIPNNRRSATNRTTKYSSQLQMLLDSRPTPETTASVGILSRFSKRLYPTEFAELLKKYERPK